VLSPDLVGRAARTGLLQDVDDLRLGGLRLAHGNLWARRSILPEDYPFACLKLGEASRASDIEETASALCGGG
jgi:hypothetical protein